MGGGHELMPSGNVIVKTGEINVGMVTSIIQCNYFNFLGQTEGFCGIRSFIHSQHPTPPTHCAHGRTGRSQVPTSLLPLVLSWTDAFSGPAVDVVLGDQHPPSPRAPPHWRLFQQCLSLLNSTPVITNNASDEPFSSLCFWKAIKTSL